MSDPSGLTEVGQLIALSKPQGGGSTTAVPEKPEPKPPEPEAIKSANAMAGDAFKTGGAKFSELTGTERLTNAQKSKIDDLIRAEIANHPDASSKTLDVKGIAQNVVAQVQALANTGLSPQVDRLVGLSATLKDAMFEFNSKKSCQIKAKAGGGINCNLAKDTINLDPDMLPTPEDFASALSHESGHALAGHTKRLTYPTSATETNKANFIKQSVETGLLDEGEATLLNLQARAEILANKGPDIGVESGSSKTKAKYIGIWNEFAAQRINRDAAIRQIAEVYRHDEGYEANYTKMFTRIANTMTFAS